MKSRLPILEVHARVDREVEPLVHTHRARLRCKKGCFECCVDDLTVFEIEADRIRQNHPELLASGRPHPEGACAFLDEEGACRIYSSRPYVCRTQGLPLRWVDETEDDELVELRDICELNEEGPDISELPVEQCWTLGPIEDALRSLQTDAAGALNRIRLRDLFSS